MHGNQEGVSHHPDQLEDLLGPEALAEYLGVPLATVYSWRSGVWPQGSPRREAPALPTERCGELARQGRRQRRLTQGLSNTAGKPQGRTPLAKGGVRPGKAVKMQNGSYPDGGTAQQVLDRPRLSRNCTPRQVFEALKSDYDVPEAVIDHLRDSVSRAAADVVDQAVHQKQTSQPYYIIRRLTGGGDWLR